MTDIKTIAKFDGLSIVTLIGFDSEETPNSVDTEGSANWFCECYGMTGDELEGPGILWTDYDGCDWQFSVLVDSSEVEKIKTLAEEMGFKFASEEVTEPQRFGDGHSGTVDIAKGSNGWYVVN